MFALRADIAVVILIPFEVRTGKCAIFALGFVNQRNERDDASLPGQPCRVLRRTMGCVCNKPVRLEAKAFFGPVNHGLRRTHFGLSD